MKKWILIMLIIAIALFGSVIGFNMFKQQKIAEYLANRPEPEYPVTTMKTAAEEWTPSIDAIGFIEPLQGVTLTAEASGIVTKINFVSGQQVSKGDSLVQLDSDVEKANLQSAQARYPAAEAKYKRYKGLYKKGAISKEGFDEAEASYLSLKADIIGLKATIDRRDVNAPFTGVVGIRGVNLGEYMQAGSRIARLEDISVMRMRFTVSQTDISRINIGQSVHVAVDSYPGVHFNATISAIEPAINYQSGLLQVQADIPNAQGKLRSGMFARAKIVLPTLTNQVVLPQIAITYTLYGDSVFVLDEKTQRVAQRVIKVGERSLDKIRILDGVKPGDIVITSGQIRLSNDSKVKIVESDATTPPSEIPML
ncbi:efflux transporter periplasmic adaptor subunit [Vibrio sp. UCD-FRSSP16_10]|uniref:efflux RND transporter periplasmic adaptor subunit n=1 Tax=unclassified Vibrio TaxID=2614977 RepID=UPI0007FD9384|nr:MULTISPECIES: efflux RND transporter periplasmic adaptor subunit [unclassified Vibrio]OBT12933.1 efflux transporter periplasmic adaptor subunit [Vibrio sp. UCD-FRSSP16_30]OBT19178.1 efflux transporter periplasmic adaptor subunit [Vibrio sp. UCD-FRSSP16_10]